MPLIRAYPAPVFAERISALFVFAHDLFQERKIDLSSRFPHPRNEFVHIRPAFAVRVYPRRFGMMAEKITDITAEFFLSFIHALSFVFALPVVLPFTQALSVIRTLHFINILSVVHKQSPLCDRIKSSADRKSALFRSQFFYSILMISSSSRSCKKSGRSSRALSVSVFFPFPAFSSSAGAADDSAPSSLSTYTLLAYR